MTADPAADPAIATRGPRWRALLEARWQARVREVTELSLAYHVAAAAVPGGTGAGQPEVKALLRRTVAARRKLADVEEALGRLAAGRFGPCEQCGSAIPAALLAAAPEIRYCPRCDAEPASVPPLAGRFRRLGLAGEVTGQEDERRRFLRGEERAVVTACPESVTAGEA